MSFLVFFFITFSQKATAQDNFTVTNYFTEHYRDFPMMKISIIPPAGFEKDENEVGFINRNNFAAIRAETVHQNIQNFSDLFFKSFDSISHQDSLGMKIGDVYNFKINHFDAHLVNLSGKIDGDDYIEWRMLIGDTSNTYIIRGFLPTDKKKELEKDIRTALLSVFYEPDRRIIAPGGDATTTSSSACSCHNKN